MYDLAFDNPAKKFMKKVKEKGLKTAIKSGLNSIQNDPYSVGERKTGSLSEYYCLDVYYTGTNYEIAYTINDNQEVVIVAMIDKRENFYTKLQKYHSNK